MLQDLRKTVGRLFLNIPGWQTDRKIVVFESDDWGSIRMPSKGVFNKFVKKGISVEESPYCKYDSLASEEDLSALFDTLLSFEDCNGNHPVFTANTVVANPDFKKIKASNFQKYFYESICDTFKRYPCHAQNIDIWKQGKERKIFYPQFHGREHVNVLLWLKLLQRNHPEFVFAFENHCWGLSNDIFTGMKRSIQAAFDMENTDEIGYQKKVLYTGLRLFENIFGYRSKSFIANNFIWDSELNKTLYENGVEYLQGMKYQKLPVYNNRKREMIRHYLGERNELGQYYLIRNCTFEPSQKPKKFNNVEECLKDIASAFFWNKPAIISSHRLNYVGFIEENNRDQNLELLHDLLNEIINRWPKVEFLTSDELGRLISK